MHVSMYRKNIHYHPGAYRMRTFLDDAEVTRHCFEADEESGFVLVYKVDHLDKICCNRDRSPMAEKLKGTVRLICSECGQHVSNPKSGCSSASHGHE